MNLAFPPYARSELSRQCVEQAAFSLDRRRVRSRRVAGWRPSPTFLLPSPALPLSALRPLLAWAPASHFSLAASVSAMGQALLPSRHAKVRDSFGRNDVASVQYMTASAVFDNTQQESTIYVVRYQFTIYHCVIHLKVSLASLFRFVIHSN